MSERLSQKLIGYRVKAAREAIDWTQDRLAGVLGLNDRQSISDIENGKRSLKPDELVLLTDALGQSIEYFLDPFAVVGEAKFSWRAPDELPKESLDDFELRAGQWIGMLRWLRGRQETQPSPLKYTLKLTAQSTYEDAIAAAEGLVETLGLGLIPAERLIEGFEQLDIPVLFVDTVETDGSSISGATCHLQDLGVILVNRNESEARRFYDIAHEGFHALTWDAMKPDHRESNSVCDRVKGKRIEQLANNFAAALLMPKQSLARMIDNRRIKDVKHLVEVAYALRVAPVSLAWRLFNMTLIDEATRNQLMQEHQGPSRGGTPKRFSASFVSMLQVAIYKGQLSSLKASKALGLTLPQLVELFSEHSLPTPFEA